MTENVRHVFDTNTLVSALLFAHSRPGQAFRHALKRGRVLLSSSTIEELAEVLQRAKFERYVTPAEREEFLAALVERALFVEPTEAVRACRDAKDDKFLELAVNGGASCIISGDDDLLALHPFRNIAIMTPAQFLRVIEEATADGKA
ncbi:MAG: putative toxin-antitoxin system toxin component, PIN family [Planctomycetes bacterium RBG_13_62_9]|nr:MAG: putative toxin-antitoxin system toxin component, PIN family [Planctomycetes bacterium RBG_13_62_9]